jgi:chorismate-pyruvate lyase
MRVPRYVSLVVLCVAGCAAPTQRAYVWRVEALALLQTLNADLLSHDSATSTLENWCAEHRLADPPRLIARRVRDAIKPIPDDLRARLSVDAGEPIAYRHVQLVCGEQVLSEAYNWYVPSRLTVEMNQQLDTTDEPFGKVVRPLGFQRRTSSVELLWSPLPKGWELQAGKATQESMQIPRAVLHHDAVLYTSAQVPFSAVAETYQNGLFAFGRWQQYLETH